MITRKLVALTAITSLAAILCSCSNDNDRDNPGTKFVRITEYPVAAGSEENFHANIVYNSAGNVTGYNEAADPGTPVYDLTFFYTGSGNKPSGATYDVSEHFFKYDASGRITQDSFIVNDPTPTVPLYYTIVKNLSYPSASLAVINITSAGSYNYKQIDSLTLDSRGNLVRSKLYLSRPGSGEFYLLSDQTWEYDDKPNPFSKLNVFPILQLDFADVYFSLSNRLFLQVNNCTSSRNIFYLENGTVTRTENYNMTLTYDTNGNLAECLVNTAGPYSPHRYVYSYE